MIFNLFKSKNSWQHKDSNVRIAAINEELSLDSDEDKSILLSLLNEDENELVRRAVLLKLDRFDDYFHASTANDHKAVQAFAAAQVRDILAGHHKVTLSNEQKHDFLNALLKKQPIDFSLINYWLEHETEPTLVLSLFEVLAPKKNIAQFLLQVFTKKQSDEIQKKLLALELPELTDTTLLAKLSKKAVNDDVMQLIEQCLAQQIAQQEKPKKLLKQNQLILAKLLALKDQSDYGQYLLKKDALVKEWQTTLTEINCLSEEEQQTLLTKYDKITTQLTQLFAPKKEAYQQAQIAEQLLNEKKRAKTEFNKTIAELNQEIITAVFEGTDTENETLVQQDFQNKLSELSNKVAESVLNESEKAEFSQQIAQLAQRLLKLPEIAQSVSEATYLISKISQLALPQTLTELNERQQTYYDWLTEWKSVDQKACGILPQSIKDAHKEITKLWRTGLKPIEQEQKQLFGQTRKKLMDLKRLLANGKYKVCFGLFKGVGQALPLLSASQQQQLQHDHDIVAEKMAEISDWEHYIATPRKQELLAEVTALVTTPLDNPNDQAEKVKQSRKIWNSLGHADEDIDKELNDKFNLACEQAFAPCRLFYAEQEKLREQHLATRKQLLKQAEALAETLKPTDTGNSSIDFKALDGQLNKLQQRWQEAGEVDRQHYQKLLKQYKEIIQPIRKAIKDFHDANGASKKLLITKAEQQLLVDDIYQAIENTKTLQQQWREVGFAGSHQESKLWQKFRSINDQVFAKRDQVKSEQQAQLDELAIGFNQTLATIKESLANGNLESNKNSLIHATEQATALLNQVLANKPILKPTVNAIEAFLKQTAYKIEQIRAEEANKSWYNLFSLLEKLATDGVDISAEQLVDEPEYQQLTTFWQKRVTEQCSYTAQVDEDIRANKTLALEILAQVDSPAELAAQRMAVQVGLIQEQMQSSADIDLTQNFVDWLRLGKLTALDAPLLTRIKKIFVPQM